MSRANKIDFSDIAKTEPRDWVDAVQGRFYRPVKQPVTIRIDADVLGWLKSLGDGYQTRINAYLRDLMVQSVQSSKKRRRASRT